MSHEQSDVSRKRWDEILALMERASCDSAVMLAQIAMDADRATAGGQDSDAWRREFSGRSNSVNR